MPTRLRGLIRLVVVTGLLAVFGVAGCGSAGGPNTCVHRCPITNHNYYLDGDDRNEVKKDTDATTKAVLAAGFAGTVHITGNEHGDWWTLVFTKCGAKEKAEACYGASRSITKPAVSRLTQPGNLSNLGHVPARNYKDNQVTVDMGSVTCNSVAQITADGLRQLPGQVADLKPRPEAYRLPSNGPAMFSCYVSS